MSEEQVAIHAARIDTTKCTWFQREPDGRWFADPNPNSPGPSHTLEEIDRAWGPTVPVRIATTDPGEPPKCACPDCHELLPDDWTHGAYCGQCISRCEPNEPTPAAGLTADQHIRAHALSPIHVHIHPEADYPDEKAAGRAAVALAQQLAAWIRDGDQDGAR